MTTHVQPSAALRGIAAAALGVLLLAACSGGATTTPPADGVSTPASDATTTVPQSTSDTGAQGAIDVCHIVTVADVQPLVKEPVTATPRTDLVGQASGCTFRTAADVIVDVTTVSGDQAATAWAEAETGPAVPGVGDQAMREPGSAIVDALKGTVMCSVDIGDQDASSYVGLATPDANGDLPDDSANAFAQKLGALCNLIFAAQ
jgi:hypothetical protein